MGLIIKSVSSPVMPFGLVGVLPWGYPHRHPHQPKQPSRPHQQRHRHQHHQHHPRQTTYTQRILWADKILRPAGAPSIVLLIAWTEPGATTGIATGAVWATCRVFGPGSPEATPVAANTLTELHYRTAGPRRNLQPTSEKVTELSTGTHLQPSPAPLPWEEKSCNVAVLTAHHKQALIATAVAKLRFRRASVPRILFIGNQKQVLLICDLAHYQLSLELAELPSNEPSTSTRDGLSE
ncbi:hypothetical protein TSAR_002835 [Trichomalopsis sarcophagae]|uniref:Uncharacterized protein n=1 Tax=Trichomalopsis sarcophagae TaxID=543379 RepID=A0A232F5N8_9HYME|nr:hypothetical protein TSAR_002835 [Trichomalopsis sarcophagae]